MGYQDGTEEKDPVAKPDHLSLVPGIHMGEGKNTILQVVLWPLLLYHDMGAHMCIHIKIKCNILITYFMITMSTNKHSPRELCSLSFQKKLIKHKQLTKSSPTQSLLFQYDFICLEDQCTCESWNIVKSLKLHCFIIIYIFLDWVRRSKDTVMCSL